MVPLSHFSDEAEMLDASGTEIIGVIPINARTNVTALFTEVSLFLYFYIEL
jgi:hypothetical protein